MIRTVHHLESLTYYRVDRRFFLLFNVASHVFTVFGPEKKVAFLVVGKGDPENFEGNLGRGEILFHLARSCLLILLHPQFQFYCYVEKQQYCHFC